MGVQPGSFAATSLYPCLVKNSVYANLASGTVKLDTASSPGSCGVRPALVRKTLVQFSEGV